MAEGSPVITHNTWYRSALFCWLGFASPVSKEVGSEPPMETMTNPGALTGTLLRNRSTEVTCLLFFGMQVEVCILSHNPTASSDTCEPFTSSPCHLPWAQDFAEVSLTLLVVKESHTITFPS